MEDYKLTELIEKKCFSELTKEEKNFIENQMTEKEFNTQHFLVKKIKESYVSEISEVPINLDLLKQLKQEKGTNKKWIIPVWLRYPIPSYSLVMVGLLFCLLFFYQKQLPEEVIVYRHSDPIILRDTIVQIDTIYKIEERKNTQLVRNIKPISKRKEINNSIKRQVVLLNENEYVFDSKLVEEQKEKIGTSNSDRDDLAQFLGVNI